jgi:hypothetical protein
MAWDAEIQRKFKLAGDRAGYRTMLTRSIEEAQFLVKDATRCGVADRRSIPDAVGRPGHTLPKLLAEYHWVTITRRRKIPVPEELRHSPGWTPPGVR